MVTTNSKTELGHLAAAKALNLPVSTKHCIEICDSLRYKDLSYAKKYLEEVVDLKRPVSFKKFIRNTGHKKGMSSGRYPTKAASEILKLMKSVEANAHFKGLNTSSLKITKLVANRAPVPFGGGRHRTGTKRTHVEVEVKERGVANKKVTEATAPVKTSHSVRDVPSGTKEHKESVATKQEHTPAHNHVHESGQDHNHNHADHEHKHEPAPTQATKPAMKAKSAVVEEPSPSDLLRKAQQKAAELNRLQKERKDTEQVTNFYEELQKKGSLRSPGVRK
ncbi:MAG: 50S ribosomal protein L22 [Nanoarchaeota archaeon]